MTSSLSTWATLLPDLRRFGKGHIVPRFGLAVVRGRSMEPTLHEGDRLLVRYGVQPRPGRIAVVRLPGRPGLSVKRIGWKDAEGWWIERDNPREGVDSWQVGAVGRDAVVAVALGRVWPRPGRLRRH
jgi:hypothetical protein